ncbi:Glycerol-3-phosphate dehydrogenase [Candidatus Izimaplasma bacterium HR1]|jgi:glycerol-3-phosphate dehydrogenase (NAD(P)+)|uniref:NAD(P)H-dependent glycerol-3-phosphate dehydrogenase n=1 Tax=Candidatus Izimoplasma sp. HR1 TaxID=1541959 RepID=UPI0004F8890E|nr:Glycerol-3-phosphate dehydrogenase [Candidatus Izimaplasma bacterium HR1]
MKISVIGGGSWGLALSNVLSNNKHEVLVYDKSTKIINKINKLHICYQLNENINEDIKATNNLTEVLNFSETVLFAVPTKVLRDVLNDVNKVQSKPKLFINAAKGIEPDTFLRVSEIFNEMIPSKFLKGFVALSGPSHAEEVIKNMTTVVTTASDVNEHAVFAQMLFNNNDYFRVYSSTDLKGVELGGALKNIFALASGLIAGKGMGDNARAALITRGLVEMEKFYENYGADTKSLKGLTGLGDLVVTCTSSHSRNYQAGFKIGHGKDLEETLKSMTMVVEGIRTCEAAYKYAVEHDLDLPIITAIYHVLFDKMTPELALKKLFERSLKSEH